MIIRKFWRYLKRIINPPLHRSNCSLKYSIFGTEYGGWPAVDGTLDRESNVLSFGIGADVTFDVAIIEKFGCTVHAFDPTPRCRDWLSRQKLPEKFRFHPIGLSSRSDTLRFFAPEKHNHVSFTQSKSRALGEMVELPVCTLHEASAKIGVEKIDLLKMDIEGSEYDAIPEILTNGPLPLQICVEFHHGMYDFTKQQTQTAVNQLRNSGYELYYVSHTGHEYAFILSTQIPQISAVEGARPV